MKKFIKIDPSVCLISFLTSAEMLLMLKILYPLVHIHNPSVIKAYNIGEMVEIFTPVLC